MCARDIWANVRKKPVMSRSSRTRALSRIDTAPVRARRVEASILVVTI
jgi:hypothetical protein